MGVRRRNTGRAQLRARPNPMSTGAIVALAITGTVVATTALVLGAAVVRRKKKASGCRYETYAYGHALGTFYGFRGYCDDELFHTDKPYVTREEADEAGAAWLATQENS